MSYKNYTAEAVWALEQQHNADYNEYADENRVCDNGCAGDALFDIYGKILCPDCLIEEVRNLFDELNDADNSQNAAAEILNDIFADFSDAEILTYIENRFEKI